MRFTPSATPYYTAKAVRVHIGACAEMLTVRLTLVMVAGRMLGQLIVACKLIRTVTIKC